MPRLSLWRENHSADYKFFDRRISELMTVGGTGVMVHKYLGADTSANDGTDATKPVYQNQSEMNIQDLLFLENRDRKYETSVYSMRGVYQVQDQDFDLKQFGIFLATGTVFMTFHLNDMIQTLGRRVISGDVLELMHLRDFDSLDQSVPVALKRFFVVSDAMRSAEGYSPTWWPHLWRVKCEPLVDSQEYKDIINNGVGVSAIYDSFISINDAIIAQSEKDVPLSGYDTTPLYQVPLNSDGTPGVTQSLNADNTATVDGTGLGSTDSQVLSPDSAIKGYLTGDGVSPNGLPIVQGIEFPSSPTIGDYCLRLDYKPNRLFRWDGVAWRKIEDSVRTNYTSGTAANQTLKSGFFNNDKLFTDSSGTIVNSRQGLSKALRPTED